MKANAPRHCLDAKSSLTLALSQRQPPSTKPLAERPVFSNSNRVKLRHATGLTAGRASLTEDQLRAYFLFLRQEKHYGGSAMKLARCALRALFRDCLRLAADWTACIAPPQTLPLVLAREQVATRLSRTFYTGSAV
jgi:hypothetical protein